MQTVAWPTRQRHLYVISELRLQPHQVACCWAIALLDLFWMFPSGSWIWVLDPGRHFESHRKRLKLKCLNFHLRCLGETGPWILAPSPPAKTKTDKNLWYFQSHSDLYLPILRYVNKDREFGAHGLSSPASIVQVDHGHDLVLSIPASMLGSQLRASCSWFT